MMDEVARERYTADKEPFFVPLPVQPHFDNLPSDKEKQYAHWISKGAMAGTAIILRQLSPEAEDIYRTIISLHRSCQGNYDSLKSKAGVTDEEMTDYLSYASLTVANNGNYKSFGDSKFIPRLAQDKFDAMVKTSPEAQTHYDKCRTAIYSHERLDLGFPSEGHASNYYPNSPDISKEEIEEVQAVLVENDIMPENTRLVKTAEGFTLLIASADTSPDKASVDTQQAEFTLSGPKTKGKKLTVQYGDHAREMGIIADCMLEASKVAANSTQADMCKEYAKSFRSGSMKAHKQSQRLWVKDAQPKVETNIGFIETYRDPAGTRAEWEGFAAMVNVERTQNFAKLVDGAPKHLPKLPWPATFEKDKFLTPDFTSLEVLNFATGGIPAGINIPNYDDIRQTEGFKNVSLGNILSAPMDTTKGVPFIRDEDRELYLKHHNMSFEVQVGLHELLGHGSGKMFQETEKGKYNFDIDNPPTNPVTNEPIRTWYKLGQTWGSVFGGMGPSYEECRAESVAMSLGSDFDVLSIFGFSGNDMSSEAGEVMFVMWLSMARAGLASLQFYDPAHQKWGQAHCQARYSILQAMILHGDGFCRLEYKEGEQADGSVSDIKIHIDRERIHSHGKPAVDLLLKQLQVFKATADLERGRALYEKYSGVDEFWATKIRPEVLRRKQPRKNFVQSTTFIDDSGKVTLKEYPVTPAGMIQSYADKNYIF